MWVVKLGGSLSRDPMLADWLAALHAHGGGRVVIVPGGGGFADAVRAHQSQWGFGDLPAHNMAVLAMVQFGMMMRGLCPGLRLARGEGAVRQVLAEGGVAVWLPFALLREAPDEMTSWDVTSDSIAAWLAGRLGAQRLVVVKACDVGIGRTGEEQVAAGVLDRAFCRFLPGTGCSLHVLGKGSWDAVATGFLPSPACGRVSRRPAS